MRTKKLFCTQNIKTNKWFFMTEVKMTTICEFKMKSSLLMCKNKVIYNNPQTSVIAS